MDVDEVGYQSAGLNMHLNEAMAAAHHFDLDTVDESSPKEPPVLQ
jgi:hypothetical protein